MNEIGSDIYMKSHDEVEGRSYGSHADYGISARRQMVGEIAQAMRNKGTKIKRGKVSVDAAALHPYINALPYEKLAHIVLSTMLDCAGAPKKDYNFQGKQAIRKHSRFFLTNVYRMIGTRIENECFLLQIRGSFRNMYNQLKAEFFTQHSGYNQKMYRMRREVASKEDFFRQVASGAKQADSFMGPEGRASAREIAEKLHWNKWSDEVKIKLGAWTARIVTEITGWFAESEGLYAKTTRSRKRKTVKLLVFSKTFDAYRERYMQYASNFSFFHIPMVVPPRDWEEGEQGGYWFGAAVTDAGQLVRGHNPKTTVGQVTLDFLNSQQRVGFKRNPVLYEILKATARRGWGFGDAWAPYVRGEPPQLTQKMKDAEILRPGTDSFKGLSPDAQDENRELWNQMRREKGAIAEWHNSQADLLQAGTISRRFLFLLEKFPETETFYFPWSLDWRTRCYPMVDACHNQGPEFMKAFLQFAQEHPVEPKGPKTKGTEFWLANAIGVAAGLSKESYDTRITWVTQPQNRRKVIAVATDPFGLGKDVWVGMDEPWFFLAYAIEYYQIFILKPGQTAVCDIGEKEITLHHKDTTSVLTGHDATCSGLQLLGGMVKDRTTCDMVNCTGGHLKPQDAYGAVLEKTLEIISQENDTFPVDRVRSQRGLVKPAVMTLPYGAGHDTRVRQIREKLREMDVRFGKSDEQNDARIEYFTKRVEDAMMCVIPGAYRILNWFQRVAREAYEQGKVDLEIETASGNVIVSSYHVPQLKRVSTESLGQSVFTKTKSKTRTKRQCREETNFQCVDETKPEGEPDVESGVLGIGANLTHGAGDAALLQLAFRDADFDYCTTHDCVYCPATSISDEIHRRVRTAFIELCEFPTLERFAERNDVKDIPPPITGDYKPEDVLQAKYFFC